MNKDIANINVGFLGLGQIGSVMAARLIGPGVTLHVFDPRVQAADELVAAGAAAHHTPREVADNASIIFASLPSREVSLQVATGDDGVLHGKALRHYVEMSTIGRDTMRIIAAALSTRGIGCVDAPVTGGVPGARRGTLSIMVSGPLASLDAVRPLLARIGGKLTELGEQPGQAQTMKLVCNLVVAGNMIVACEGLAMGAKAGLDPQKMLDLLNSGTARSATTSDILTDAVLNRRFAFGARVSIIDKDVRIGLDEAKNLGVPTPVISTAAALWNDAVLRHGIGDEDFTAILLPIERAAGTRVGGTDDFPASPKESSA